MKIHIPPVVVVLLIGTLMRWVAGHAWSGSFRLPGQGLVAGMLLSLGLLIPVLGVHRFRVADTTVDPLHPEKASALVDRGVYRYSRNPMYLGLALLLAGWGIRLGSLAGLLGVPLFVIYMRYFQIGPEEEAMEKRFGEAYREYRSKVRRWI